MRPSAAGRLLKRVQDLSGEINNIPGVTLKVLSSGTISGGAALAGDVLEILSGGLVSGVTVSSGATEIVSAGGSATDTTVSSGGTVNVL